MSSSHSHSQDDNNMASSSSASSVTLPGTDQASEALTDLVCHIRAVVTGWKPTCPGDINGGYFNNFNGFVSECMEYGVSKMSAMPFVGEDDMEELIDDDDDLFSTIQYRSSAATFIDECIVAGLGLSKPGGQSCLEWSDWDWMQNMFEASGGRFASVYELSKHMDLETDRTWDYLVTTNGNLFGGKMEQECIQGPPFTRLVHYAMAALYESGLSPEASIGMMDRMIDVTADHCKYFKRKAREDKDVQKCLRRYKRIQQAIKKLEEESA